MPWQGQHGPIQGAGRDQDLASAATHNARVIDLMPGIGIATGAPGFRFYNDLDYALLGVVEGIEGGVLGRASAFRLSC
jgi:hypothetical protein